MSQIGIVLATYNGEKFLSEMLLSLKNQSRQADWIIAVDDASKDSTVQILEQFKNELPLHILKNETNKGHRETFSKGLEYAKNFAHSDDFIALADQDDIWKEDKLKILEAEIKNNVLIFGDAEIINSKGEITNDSWRTLANIKTQISLKEQIAGINNVTGCLSLFKASLLNNILPIPQKVTVHDRWIAMIAERNGGIKAINNKIVQYRIHENNAVGGRPAPAMSVTLATQKEWLSMILENEKRLNLQKDEILFTQKLLRLTQSRITHYTSFRFLPWIFKNKNYLFLRGSFGATLKRILFTAIGLPLAKILWKKS